jgi:hypothetical protein
LYVSEAASRAVSSLDAPAEAGPQAAEPPRAAGSYARPR